MKGLFKLNGIVTSSIRNIPPTELLTYYFSDLLQYWTYASCVFLYYLKVRWGKNNFWAERCGYDRLRGRAPRLGHAWGPSAAAMG